MNHPHSHTLIANFRLFVLLNRHVDKNSEMEPTAFLLADGCFTDRHQVIHKLVLYIMLTLKQARAKKTDKAAEQQYLIYCML